jgi:hypothetical protein
LAGDWFVSIEASEMIELLQLLGPDGRPYVRQSLIQPAVYLDTWAICDFAENSQIGGRFRDALIGVHGTLFFSSLNLIDFAGMDDPRHMQNAAEFIGSIAPHLFFSHFDPLIVCKREFEIMTGNTKESPAGDSGLLAQFAASTFSSNMREAVVAWFRAMYQARGSLRADRNSMAQSLFLGIQGLRDRMLAEPEIVKDMRQPAKNADRPRSTFALMRILIGQMEADHSLPKKTHHAIDFLHCVVPAAYCSYILSDAQWYARLNQAKQLIEAAGIAARVATPYTKRDNGVEAFLTALESQKVMSIT